MIGELTATLRDARECGDWCGHLQAWVRVATGRDRPGDRVTPTGHDKRRQQFLALWEQLTQEQQALVLRWMRAMIGQD